MRPAVATLLTVALATTLMGASCREETPAMKKANLGRAFTERGAHDRAIKTLQEAVKLDPELVMSYELLGQALEAAGRYDEALDAYRETVRREPTRDTAYASLGCLLLSAEGAVPDAEAALNRAIGLNQAFPRAQACLGAIYLDQRQFDKAVEMSQAAVTMDPQNVQAHLNLGIAYAETGDVERARAEIRKTIQFARGNEQLISQARVYLEALEHPEVDGGPAAGI